MERRKEAPKVPNELDKEHGRTTEACQERGENRMEEFIKAIIAMNSYIANRHVKDSTRNE